MKQKNISNKLIIGCIGITILIILTSFTTIAGKQNTNSSNNNHSPLFNIRTLRAINKQNREVVTSEYIGKGKILNLPLPKLNKNKNLQKAVDGISLMNDKTFNKFLSTTITQLLNAEKIKNEDISKIKEIFQFFRENPNKAKNALLDAETIEQTKLMTKACELTVDLPCHTLYETPGLCYFLLVLLFPIWFPIFLAFSIFANITVKYTCYQNIACD